MKTLKEYLTEGVLDIEDNVKKIDRQLMNEIQEFIDKNYETRWPFKIHVEFRNGKYIAYSAGDVITINKNIEHLTNGMFEWTYCGGFSCSWCELLKDLKGAPKSVGRGSFYCHDGPSLISLEGAPEKVEGHFHCNSCGKKFTESDVKKVCKVKGKIIFK